MCKIVITEKREKYANWVARVTAFLAETGPILGEKGTHCCTFQSKPVLDKCPDVVYLGYNPHEAWEFFKEDVSPERFYEGNPGFYSESRKGWRVWRLANAFEWADYQDPIKDGNFVFFNAVYFGSEDIASFKKIPGSSDAIEKCLTFTEEVIRDIFMPKCVVCFSVPDCFDLLNKRFVFKDVNQINTAESTDRHLIDFATSKEKGAWKGIYTCSKPVIKGDWDGIPVYGIPHPSSSVSNDDLGAIALYLRSELQKMK